MTEGAIERAEQVEGKTCAKWANLEDIVLTKISQW
jgi:hypothetical protein